MAKLYGLGNVIISEVATRLMTNSDFNKLVYYKDIDEDGEDILSMPDLEDPVTKLYKKHLHLGYVVPYQVFYVSKLVFYII